MRKTLILILVCIVILQPVISWGTTFQGVNLGGWLVLESWIKPSLFSDNGVPAGSGEFQFCQHLGKTKCLQVLQNHWDSFVTYDDLQTLRSHGITHLRIPLGYWILGDSFINSDEAYVSGGWNYLIKVLKWSKQLGLKALLDLHGAPGSQNGHDNSGFSGNIGWAGDKKDQYRDRTVQVLEELARRANDINSQQDTQGVVSGIEVLNEPWTTAVGGPIQLDYLKNFFQTAVDQIRAAGWQGDIVIADGWNKDWDGWKGFLSPPQYQNVYSDTHNYYCFDPYHQSLNPWDLVWKVCTDTLPGNWKNTNDWLVVGEWTAAMTQGPSYPFDDNGKKLLKDFVVAQWQAAGMFQDPSKNLGVKGQFFWNFKIGDHDKGNGYQAWDYLLGIQEGWIPNLNNYNPKGDYLCNPVQTQQQFLQKQYQ